MPELPEVETIRRQLAPAVSGRVLRRLEVLDARWCEPLAPSVLEDAVEGRTVRELGRRGKYLDFALEDDVHLIMHLRMTGTLLLDPQSTPAHTRVRMTLTDHELLFVDPRRFGTGQLVLGPEALELFYAQRLGVEPFDPRFSGELLHALVRGRRTPIKAFLLDQRQIAGIGNIYADEALFRARLHPLRPAGGLTRPQCDLLRDAVLDTLSAGIDARGASIDDFRHLDGARGSFQDRFLVHRREGEPCPRCGTTIRKLKAAGRGTYICPHCQRLPRKRSAPSPRAR